jgi:hypothetical protein
METTSRETHVLKSLTVIALVYIPASFTAVWTFGGDIPVAPTRHATVPHETLTRCLPCCCFGKQDLLQMGYIDVEQGEHGLHIQAKGGLQVYGFIALPLVAVTMALYAFSEFMQRRTLRARAAEGSVVSIV